MNETDPPMARPHTTFWTITVVAFILLYALIPGAWFAAMVRGGWRPSPGANKAFEAVFAPIPWMMRSSQTMDSLYAKYFGLCTGVSESQFRQYGKKPPGRSAP